MTIWSARARACVRGHITYKMPTTSVISCCNLIYLIIVFSPIFSQGIMGLQWAKHLGNAVKVTINDLNENSVTLIQKNCHLNKLKVVVDSEEKEEGDALEEDDTLGDIQVTRMDANVLMHLRSFDFM